MAASQKKAASVAQSKTVPKTASKAGKLKLSSSNSKDFDDSTKLLFDRIRLGIIATLSVEKSAAFSELVRSLEITDGNLSTHAKKLETAGLIQITKKFVDRKPRTEFQITTKGKRALQGYLDYMESIIQTTRSG